MLVQEAERRENIPNCCWQPCVNPAGMARLEGSIRQCVYGGGFSRRDTALTPGDNPHRETAKYGVSSPRRDVRLEGGWVGGGEILRVQVVFVDKR
jgi:hypothetical protein